MNSSILLEPEEKVTRPRLVTHDEAAYLLLHARTLPSIRVEPGWVASPLVLDQEPPARELALADEQGTFGVLEVVEVLPHQGKVLVAGRITVTREVA